MQNRIRDTTPVKELTVAEMKQIVMSTVKTSHPTTECSRLYEENTKKFVENITGLDISIHEDKVELRNSWAEMVRYTKAVKDWKRMLLTCI